MYHLTSPTHATVSYDIYGSGAPLVLVHGAFSDHITNWEFVKPLLEQQFTVYAIARRGRGKTDATQHHSLDDESIDVAALIREIDEPVFLLGHSYGAHTALAAAASVPERVRKLVLYEAPWPHVMDAAALAQLEALALVGDWEEFALSFFRDRLFVPAEELEHLKKSEFWPPILADAEASLGDLRALSKYKFDAAQFGDLSMPVLLQIGTESPRHLYVTDTLAAVLPEAHIDALAGQAHEGMTTAPDLYASSVCQFLLK